MTKKKKKNKITPDKVGEIQNKVIKYIGKLNPPYPVKQVIKKLGIKDQRSKKIARNLLKALNSEGEQVQISGKGYIEGKVDYVNPRFAYIVSEETETDLLVKSSNLKFALDDDLVKVKILPTRRGKRQEGEVVEIIKRSRDTFVGKIELSKNYAFVVPDFKKMHFDIFVPLDKSLNAQKNDKVVVRITTWPDRNKNPEGEIVEILGQSGDNEAEIHSIIHEFGLPYKFPQKVITQAKRIKEEISKEEIEKRRDMRSVTTFTIDPVDAKDFDDALSIQTLEDGNYEIGIHIADVTHYLKEGTLLDKEALQRGTSVYLVDRTIPMLPEKLSNELCSLRPNEDKLCFSAIFTINSQGKILNEWFGRTIIYSDRRFTYEEAQERIESLKGDFARELTLLNELALKLRLDRFMRGSINFETTEFRFDLDENGKPLAVHPKIRKDSHKLVEDFMLLANKRVAEFIYTKRKNPTFVYRTHDYPDPDKLKVFSVFAQRFGYKLHLEEEAISKSLNSLIEDVEGKPEQNVLQTLAIRSMAKAKYTTEAVGHFGLAFPHYTHFTSPIRRYPDVMVHRLLDHYLQKGKSVDKKTYEDMCIHSSEMEKRASDAERVSIKYKQVEYMSDRVGEEFDGIISGVTEWGIYVELTETHCEGMIRLADLEDDFYQYDEENYRIIGQNHGKLFTLGDDMRVKVVEANIDKRTIDLELISHTRKV